MKRKFVYSSVIRTVGYDAISLILEIEFQTGKIYQYTDVPPEIYDELLSASSVGKFYNEVVKEGFPMVEVI